MRPGCPRSCHRLRHWRFRRKVAFHLYAGKAANWIIALFACHTLLLGPVGWLVYLMATIAGYALLEEIILVTTRDRLDEHVTSVFDRRPRDSEEWQGAP